MVYQKIWNEVFHEMRNEICAIAIVTRGVCIQEHVFFLITGTCMYYGV